MEKSSRPWFQSESYDLLEIHEYRSTSDHTVTRSVVIDDAWMIREMMDCINSIPEDGDEMKSFGGGAAHTDLIFSSGTDHETIGIYSKSLKTPSTGFHSEKSQMEKDLLSLVEDILSSQVSS